MLWLGPVFLAKIWSLHTGFITSTRVLGRSTGTMFLAWRGQSHAHQPGVPLRIPCSSSQCVSSLQIPRESVDSAHAIRKDPGLGGRCHGSDHGWAWHGDHPWSPAWCAAPHSSMPTLSFVGALAVRCWSRMRNNSATKWFCDQKKRIFHTTIPQMKRNQ